MEPITLGASVRAPCATNGQTISISPYLLVISYYTVSSYSAKARLNRSTALYLALIACSSRTLARQLQPAAQLQEPWSQPVLPAEPQPAYQP